MPVLCNVVVDKDEIEQLKDLQLDFGVKAEDLQELVNQTMNENGNDDVLGFNFYVNDVLLTKTLGELIYENKINLEQKVMIQAIPQEKIQVSTLTRCSATLPGHEDAVLCLSFSPCSRYLASGSGDKTVRIWDVFTGTCSAILRHHKEWVLAVRFSPDGSRLVSADHQGNICVWSRTTTNSMSNWILLHTSGSTSSQKRNLIWITSVTWYYTGEYFFAGLKDGGIRFYDKHGNLKQTINCSSKAITSVTVTINHLIVSSEDCKAYVYSLPTYVVNSYKSQGSKNAENNSNSDKNNIFKLLNQIKHGHWVNSVTSNQDFYMRYGVNAVKRLFTLHKSKIQEKYSQIQNRNDLESLTQAQQFELLRHIISVTPELILTASDDNTMKITQIYPTFNIKATLAGHTRQINQAFFSPNNHFIASCSFDRTVRLWNAEGKFIQRFQTHASEVYQLVFSSDSRLLLSCGKDSTCKLYSVNSQKLLKELPGHQDEVYCVDWSLDGEYGASGSKDKMVKLWRR